MDVITLSSLKAQYSIMEYLFMTIFVILIIIALIFVVFVFQFSQIQFDAAGSVEAKLDSITTSVLNSQIFVKDDSMFDDGKLASLLILDDLDDATEYDLCKELKDVFGYDFFVEIRSLNLTQEFEFDIDNPDTLDIDFEEIEGIPLACTKDNFGEILPGFTIDGHPVAGYQCNKWVFCLDDTRKYRANTLPVNIYRRFGKTIDSGILPSVDLGEMRIGVYV